MNKFLPVVVFEGDCTVIEIHLQARDHQNLGVWDHHLMQHFVTLLHHMYVTEMGSDESNML